MSCHAVLDKAPLVTSICDLHRCQQSTLSSSNAEPKQALAGHLDMRLCNVANIGELHQILAIANVVLELALPGFGH